MKPLLTYKNILVTHPVNGIFLHLGTGRPSVSTLL